MKAILHIVILLIIGNLSYACAQKNTKKIHVDNYIPAYTSDQLFHKLKYYIDHKQKDSIDYFFQEWHASIKPNTDKYINSNDTLRAIHDIFRIVYKPFNLNDLQRWKWENNQNERAKYIAVQNEIYYAIVTKEDDEDILDTPWAGGLHLTDFRPHVDVAPEKVLYLAPEYNEALTKLLKLRLSMVDKYGNIVYTQDYCKIIYPYIPVSVGHWGNYWHIETHPHIHSIAFDTKMSTAYAFFRIGYGGGKAKLEKKNGKWQMISSGMTWIE